MYLFQGKYRNMDFEDLKDVKFRDGRIFQTEDKKIAEKLRKKKDVFEVTSAFSAPQTQVVRGARPSDIHEPATEGKEK